jgi:O-acetylserine/cysteine efflux transporter
MEIQDTKNEFHHALSGDDFTGCSCKAHETPRTGFPTMDHPIGLLPAGFGASGNSRKISMKCLPHFTEHPCGFCGKRRFPARPIVAGLEGFMKTHLTWRDAILALAIVFVWGTNFVVIRVALDALPPLFLATMRFVLVLLPACFFVPRPKVSWANLVIYGLCIGMLQFGALFIAMNGRISPGLASLVVQMQVFFTIGLAMIRTGERLKAHHLLALALALAGMGVIAGHSGQGTTLAGLSLVLVAALGWALGNQASREAGPVNMLAYVVWAALFAIPPLLGLSLWLEGPAAIAGGLARASALTWASVAWQSVGNTLFGYSCWAWLLSRYPAATVAPLSLLVPVFGFGASALLLGEPLPAWKIEATILIMAGLGVNLLWRPGKAAISGEAA